MESSDLAARRDRRAVALGAALVVSSYVVVRTGVGDELDAAARRRFASRGRRRDRLVAVATDLGSVYAAAGACGALALRGDRRRAIDVAAATATAWCAAQAAKPALRRQRPYEGSGASRLVAIPAGSSWPSGHAAVMTASAVTLGPGVSTPVHVGFAAVVTGVGLSRITVGVHHLTDVVAGVGVGAIASVVASRLTGALRRALRRSARS